MANFITLASADGGIQLVNLDAVRTVEGLTSEGCTLRFSETHIVRVTGPGGVQLVITLTEQSKMPESL